MNLEMPLNMVSLWLNKLYVSIIDPDRSREAFKRTNAFMDDGFKRKVAELSDEADRAVFDASFVGDLPEIKAFLADLNPDLLDIIIFRFNRRRAELESAEGTLQLPGQKSDVLALFRILLIENEQIRNGAWPTH